MKNFILLIILGCFSIYGFSITPIDPPKKTGDTDKTVTPQKPTVSDQCSESRGLAEVIIYVTFTDCPDYDCEAKLGCSFNICVYDYNYTLLDCKAFDPDKCDYTFEGLRATEGYSPWARLVPVGTCGHEYNDAWMPSTDPVPPGGGDVYIDTYLCQD